MDDGARLSSLRAVCRLPAPDRFYDLQLLRDLEIINAMTQRELGALPTGGVPVAPRRKPDLSEILPTEKARDGQFEEIETMKFRSVVMAAITTATSGCVLVGQGMHRHAASTVESGVLKIPFSNHSFDARCYDTLRCRVLYEKSYIVNDGGPRGPFTDLDYRNLGGHWISLESPSVARVTWTSRDGENHDEKIDLGEIFRSRLVRYPTDLDVNDVNIEVSPGNPDIILVVEDRSVRVYMKAWIPLLKPRYPGRRHSNFRHDPVVAYLNKF